MQPNRAQIHDWLVRLADGDRSAFDPLYRGTRPLLDSFARRLLPTKDEAEDAAQQALLTGGLIGMALALTLAGVPALMFTRAV